MDAIVTSDGDDRPLVLVVEDDEDLAAEITDTLTDYGMHALRAGGWEEAVAVLAERQPALILLDQRLGSTDAVPLLPRLRELSAAPVVILTGNRDETDRIVALEVGADDFLVKPVSGRELVARIRAHLRREKPRAAAGRNGEAGWHLDTLRRRLRRPDGSDVDLTSAEFDLLVALVQAPGTALDRDTLTRRVLNRAWRSDDRSLDNLVARLRRKLGPGGERTIATVRGQGYAFTDFDAR